MSALAQLLDVEVPVMVRFGGTTMLLRDVLALEAGSLVKLGRAAEDPVELVMNGRVVARGTVVSIRGNYGLRITEVIAGASR